MSGTAQCETGLTHRIAFFGAGLTSLWHTSMQMWISRDLLLPFLFLFWGGGGVCGEVGGGGWGADRQEILPVFFKEI